MILHIYNIPHTLPYQRRKKEYKAKKQLTTKQQICLLQTLPFYSQTIKATSIFHSVPSFQDCLSWKKIIGLSEYFGLYMPFIFLLAKVLHFLIDFSSLLHTDFKGGKTNKLVEWHVRMNHLLTKPIKLVDFFPALLLWLTEHRNMINIS